MGMEASGTLAASPSVRLQSLMQAPEPSFPEQNGMGAEVGTEDPGVGAGGALR